MAESAFLLLSSPEIRQYCEQHTMERGAAIWDQYLTSVQYPKMMDYFFDWEWHSQVAEGVVYTIKPLSELSTVPLSLNKSKRMIEDDRSFNAKFGIAPQLTAALDVGPAVAMRFPSKWWYSTVPERLPQLLNIGEQHGHWLTVGEAAKPYFKQTSFSFIKRAYLKGLTAASDVWGTSA